MGNLWKRLPILIIVLTACALQVEAQYFRNSNYWKTHRNELTIGLGASNFLGELGGRDQIGSPFIWDLELSQTKPTLSVGFRYYTFEKQALRANLAYGVLAGNDNLTSEPFRQDRNLNFRSDLFEFSLVYEIHFFKEQLGHIYDLRGVSGEKSSRVGLYVFGGVCGFYFNPKADVGGTLVELQPLNTEGQGLPDGPEEYTLYQIGIPMGLGLRKSFSKQISGGLELQYTKTFTDYIDDVSTVYYDNEALAAARGPLAAFLADPSLGKIDGMGATNSQRGDSSDYDAYLFLKFQIHYKLYKYRSSSKKYRTRIRRQKIVF
ncbi:MAG: DUF6089 family protein [Flavobacteriales bacterium]|nr:hypothetical protein [Flavobacteriales bacterium]MCB0784283.1 hypothetical protein [Flavobacteriales bacterium]MCB0809247.1 hypothetical protein [Flavobacteriales bacterium]MCB0811961.1 hypothetical protein [Flavobacteriales bacterium]MCB0817312.1 hypothetical protein [Flavobacteriales bacterium]